MKTTKSKPPTLCEGCHKPPTDHGFKARRKECMGCGARVGPCCRLKQGPGGVPLECECCKERGA